MNGKQVSSHYSRHGRRGSGGPEVGVPCHGCGRMEPEEWDSDTSGSECLWHDSILVGLWDGHGGDASACAVSARLHDVPAVRPKEWKEWARRIHTEWECSLHRQFSQSDTSSWAGSTSLVAWLGVDPDDAKERPVLCVANVGDCGALLCGRGVRGAVERLTHDHTPIAQRSEATRLMAEGVHVDGNLRVEGVLGLSRVLGDFELKHDWSPDKVDPTQPRGGLHPLGPWPDTAVVRLERRHELFIMCSDGIFDVFSDEEIAGIVREALHKCPGDVDAACESLCSQAVEAGSEDNVTAIVLHFDRQ